MKRLFKIIGFTVVCAAMLHLTVPMAIGATAPDTRARLQQSVATTKGKVAASRTGRVRVIARLSEAAVNPARSAATPPRNAPGAYAFASLDTPRPRIRSAQDQLLRRMTALGAVAAKRVEGVPMVVLEVNGGELDALTSSGEVAAVFEDKIALPTLNQSGPLVGADVAHNLGAGGGGTTIAVLDTGVFAAHEFLAGRVRNGACFSTNSFWASSQAICPGGSESSTAVTAGNPCIFGGCDHGTHVAGIAAGRSSAAFAVNGMAPDATILPIQVFSRVDGTPKSFESDQIAGLQFVRDRALIDNIVAINMSLGSGEELTSCDDNPLKELIDRLRNMGIATVVSSGNDSFNHGGGSPGCISTAVTVGASGKDDSIADFSNHSSTVDLLAPGVGIKSSTGPGANVFGRMSGTSMAAPHVAGAIAMIRSKAAMSVDQAVSLLQATGDPVSGPRNNPARVRINIGRAMSQLVSGPPAAEIDRRRLIRLSAGRCLDVHRPLAGQDGGRVQVWSCNGQPQQLWTAGANGSLRNEAGGLCLDVRAVSDTKNGDPAQMRPCNTSASQRWTIVPSSKSIKLSSGQCLDVNAADRFYDGGPVQVWSCNGQPQQRWTFVAPDVLAREANIRTGAGLCLEVHAPAIESDGGRVQVWSCMNQPQQRWTYDRNTRALRVASGLCLDVDAPSMATNGGRVQVWACNGQRQQQWTPLANGGLRNEGGLCLDVHAPDQTKNGGRVQVWQCSGLQQQRFTSSAF